MRSRFIAVLSVVVLALALTILGCGGPKETPADVVKAASDASQRGDVDELERRLDAAMFAELLKAGGGDREKLREQLLESGKQAIVKTYRVTDSKIDGDKATVDTEAVVRLVTTSSDIRTRGRTHLTKVDNAWRISGVELLGQPEVVNQPQAPGPE